MTKSIVTELQMYSFLFGLVQNLPLAVLTEFSYEKTYGCFASKT